MEEALDAERSGGHIEVPGEHAAGLEFVEVVRRDASQAVDLAGPQVEEHPQVGNGDGSNTDEDGSDESPL